MENSKNDTLKVKENRNKKNSRTAQLFSQGKQAQAEFDYPKAIELFSAALDEKDVPRDLAYDILDQRAECHDLMGEFSEVLADLDEMMHIAQDLDDPHLQTRIVFRGLFTAARMGNASKINDISKATQGLKEEYDDISIDAAINLAIGYHHWISEERSEAQNHFEQALRKYRAAGNREGEGNTLQALGAVILDSGNQDLSAKYSQDALEIWRSLGNRRGEARALNAWSLTMADYAQKRDAGEEALEIFISIGDRWGQCQMYNNLSLLYGHLGLYSTAVKYAKRAVGMVREMGALWGLALYLDSLARAEMNVGDFSAAEVVFREGQLVAQEVGSKGIESFVLFGLGRVALMSGKAEVGREAIRTALESFREIELESDIPTTLAWLGAAYLALDDPKTARMYTAEAVTELEVLGYGGAEYPPQEVWWWHYQALTYELRQDAENETPGDVDVNIPDGAWSALQKARDITIEGIASLSDEGLRRNYLNKVEINREIITQWAKHATLRGLAVDEPGSQSGNVQAQLQRQLAIGVRMNERREISALTDFVMGELIELSGAERAMLVLFDEAGDRQVAGSYGINENTREEFLLEVSELLERVAITGVPVLIQDAADGDVTSTSTDAQSSLSILCMPLHSRGITSGLIYVDNHSIFGKFNSADEDVLASFANQVASALENAQLYQDLEKRVEERTVELITSNEALEQLNAELGIINSVQDGLATKLNFQEIIDLVGSKIQEIFEIQNLAIAIFDREQQLVQVPFFVENGKRFPSDPFPYEENSGVIAHVLKTGKPLLATSNFEAIADQLGSKHSLGDSDAPMAQSALIVPILVGEQAIGTIGMFDYEDEAFNEADKRLLTTLANSMGVALENARLFDETNRLLDETQQRSAELAIITSVQEGLAEELDIPSIFELVGEKIREIFDAQVVMISTFDHQQKIRQFPYFIEKGERLSIDPSPFNQLTYELIEKRKPVVINQDAEVRTKELGMTPVRGSGTHKSLIFVPMVIGDSVAGFVSLQNLDRENAFPESAVNLLTTLTGSMSVALENARLFDETNRLLEETQQRSAELAIINSVQEALASKLEFQSVIDFVGDKLQEVLSTNNIEIRLIDKSADRVDYLYMYEHGKRIEIPSAPIAGISKYFVETMEPLVIHEDLTAKVVELGSYTIPGTDTAKSLMAVPFTIRQDMIGGIIIEDYEKEHAFSDSDLSLLTTLAASMSVALENARLFDETNRLLDESQQRNAELTILNSVGDAMAQNQDVDTITRIVGDKVRDIFKAEATDILLFNSQDQMISLAYGYNGGYVDHPPFKYGEGLTSKVIETRQPLMIGTAEDAIERGAITNQNIYGEVGESYLGVPIIVGDRVLGVVSVGSYRKHAYDDSSMRLLSTLATSMGVAIENARLFEETNRLLVESQQQAAEMVTVNTVGQAITSEIEFDALIELIGNQVRDIFDADITYVALYERRKNLIEFPYVYGEDLDSMEFGEGLTSKIIQTAEPLLINEDVNQQVDEMGATHSGVDVQSYLGVPIMVGKNAIGVISVQSMQESGRFFQDDVRLLTTIAANVGAAIRNAQLYHETQQRADEMAALTEISREISATLDLKQVLERIATRAQALLHARTATIRLLDEDGNMPTLVALGKYAEKHRGTKIQLGEGITGNVAKTGKAEIINDPRQDSRILHVPGTPDEEEEQEAIIFAPLMVAETVIGVMGLWRDRTAEGPFSEEDLNFLKNLARQAANAIQNARLFEEVQRQKLYSEALLENSPVAIMTSDLDNNVVSWNPAAEALFGYPAEEAIGKPIVELISDGKFDEEIGDNFAQIQNGGRVSEVTQRYRKDGSPVDVELLALPVVMEGKNVGLIAIYHDITELLRARHEAEAANDAKSAFLATMSHEIRTPMNGVIGMTSLLLETELDPEQRDYTETIRNSGEALLTVINDILDFSKIEAGKMELEEQPFDLRDCLESSLDLLKLSASEKGVELAYQMSPDVPSVIVGDITRLRQVLINLLNNGLKFTEQGEVVLSVETKAVPIYPDGPYTLHFSVCDTGIGIPPDRLNRLFQAFSQVDASTSRKYGGTGLGLAISKRLSELMGGEMWVESVEGDGTTFHFTIAVPAGPDLKSRKELRGEQPKLSGKRLLIVDDNLTNRRILTLQTRTWGMLPRDTADPMQALTWIRQGDPFDLAILDYHMPGMDGIELSRAIRELTDIPLVLFSSISAREAALEESQFAAYLMKPLKPSVLLDTLMNLFAGEVKQIETEPLADKATLDPEMAKRLPLRILLVEDNAVNQKLAVRLLSQMGYRADLAGNGLEAIQAVGRQKYDVVLMDVQMPEMDGLEASRRICARWPRGERPYIVAMTANAMQGDRERCLEAGMDDYVSKPIRVNELVAALGKAKPVGIVSKKEG